MNALLTYPLVRLSLALVVWAGAGLLGWWWHRPPALLNSTTAATEASSPIQIRGLTDATTDGLSAKLQRQDPFALQRAAQAPAPGAAGASAPGTDAIEWRFSALTEVRGEHRMLLTAADQPPLLLKSGDKLPNGERIKSIDATTVLLQDAKGRKRTIHLIDP